MSLMVLLSLLILAFGKDQSSDSAEVSPSYVTDVTVGANVVVDGGDMNKKLLIRV